MISLHMEIYLAGLQRVNVHVQCVAPILTVLDYRYQENFVIGTIVVGFRWTIHSVVCVHPLMEHLKSVSHQNSFQVSRYMMNSVNFPTLSLGRKDFKEKQQHPLQSALEKESRPKCKKGWQRKLILLNYQEAGIRSLFSFGCLTGSI